MAGELEVRTDGAARFAALGKDLRRAGATGVRKRLYSGLNRAARPAVEAARAGAQTLPSSGGRGRMTGLRKTGTKTVGGKTYVTRVRVSRKGKGGAGDSLAARAAKARYKVQAVAGKDPRIRITATSGGKKLDLERADEGTIRHMVWGNRRVWVSQKITPGWFTRPMEAQADEFRRALEGALDDIERDISG